jgi:hypothetical protein
MLEELKKRYENAFGEKTFPASVSTAEGDEADRRDAELAAGKAQAGVARTYTVDPSTIYRLHRGSAAHT